MIAQKLYAKKMDFYEKYESPDDSNYNGSCRIWTKVLFDDEPLKWNNRSIKLKETLENEKIYYKKYIEDFK